MEEILKQLDYQPNMYASALASNKKYTFICLLPQHLEGEYWTAVELGIHEAIATYSDFNTSVKINYYDPYDYHSFVDASEAILTQQPDGVMVAPTAPQYTKGFTDQLQTLDIPYIYIDSNIKDVPPLAFFGQNSRQSGYFAARMLMLLARDEKEIVISVRYMKELSVLTSKRTGKSDSGSTWRNIIRLVLYWSLTCMPNAMMKITKCWMNSSVLTRT